MCLDLGLQFIPGDGHLGLATHLRLLHLRRIRTNANVQQGGRTPAYHDLSANFSFLIKPNIILHGSVSNVLGTENIFGYEYASEPNSDGIYNSRPIKLPAPRFAFLGLFITLSKDNSINQLPNL